MFSRISNFVYRHRRKFILGGILTGGYIFATKFAERKILEWQERETNIMLEKQKRRQHFDSTKRTANTTVLSLGSSIKEIIIAELDSDALLQSIRSQESIAAKTAIWQNLKEVSFTRTVSVIYATSLMTCVVHVQLMLLGGYVYGDLIHDKHAGATITPHLQQRYLLTIRNFVNDGMVSLIKHIEKAVQNSVKDISLTELMNLKKIENLIQNIVLDLNGSNCSTDGEFTLSPWSHYVSKCNLTESENLSSSVDTAADYVLKNMITETSDVLDGNDFNDVFNCLVQQGINHMLDEIANYFPVQDLTPIINEDDQSENYESAVVSSLLIDSVLPVAKIIPILCHLSHSSLSSSKGDLLHNLLNDGKLESLSYNVYEGFSVPLMKSI